MVWTVRDLRAMFDVYISACHSPYASFRDVKIRHIPLAPVVYIGRIAATLRGPENGPSQNVTDSDGGI